MLNCTLILGLMTLELNALLQSLGHAAHKLSALLFTDSFILLSDALLQLLGRAWVAMLDAVLEHVPEILDGVEVRRARRELHDVHSVVVHPRVDCRGVVRAGVVLQEAPEATRVEALVRRLEVVLE